MDNKYCAAPFRHLAVSNKKNSDWQPCCAWLGNGIPISENPFNGPMITDLRERLLDGRGHPGCQRCHDNEVNGGISNRIKFNREHGYVTDPILTNIEFNLGNLCNLKCRMCSSRYSTKWMADDALFGEHHPPLVRRTLGQMDIDPANLTHIMFVGGEPTLEQDAVREALSAIERSRGGLGHLTVELVTNATRAFDDDLIGMLLRCGKATVTVSIDGMHVTHAYQRTGGDLDVAMGISKIYHELVSSNFNIVVNSVISLLNIHDATNLLDHVAVELPKAWHQIMQVYNPKALSPRNLPDPYKKELLHRISSWEPVTVTDSTEQGRARLMFMLSMDRNLEMGEVIRYVDLLDKARGERLSEVLPDLDRVIRCSI